MATISHSGQLPSKIISWANLNILSLSGNNLSGPIPSALGSLPVLIYLDLSNNQLSAPIPPEIGLLKLTFLKHSYNKLTGRVPFGYNNAAFQTSFLNTSLCSESGVLDLSRCSIHRGHAKNLVCHNLALIIILALVAILAIVYFCSKIFKLKKRKHTEGLSSRKVTSFHRLDFTEENILTNLTETNLIGAGGSGQVYKILMNGSGGAVAVKKMWDWKRHNEKEFLAEVQILGRIMHLNKVKLLCCMSSEKSKILVYEYMENQSLDKWIHKGKQRPVSWMSGLVNPVVFTGLKVAVGAAQGLSYTHHDCSPPNHP